MSKKSHFSRSRFRTPAKMELFVTVLYGSRPCVKSIVTRTSILNVNNGPRPAFDYSGIWYNSFKLVYGGPLLSI